ncbi:hypothetical protein DPMN_015134 [Dreissena polymorpha]|uniref:Uncharacterized protein n=1 Tax=Dreissena polymorpha TaxID=45954 RepID=A0A9D4S5B2_DREPO|nr:hypothetical protein DPMN_015134 [Dreissena polymorpha]
MIQEQIGLDSGGVICPAVPGHQNLFRRGTCFSDHAAATPENVQALKDSDPYIVCIQPTINKIPTSSSAIRRVNDGIRSIRASASFCRQGQWTPRKFVDQADGTR